MSADDAPRPAAFKDHFSARAATYAANRPGYPDALFDWIVSLAPGRACVWDCATGNGQAAVALAERFDRVVATDASATQIEHATPHARVEYRVAPAEASGLADASVDVVTVAQALHWFDRRAFFAEARRVLRPGGAVVVWSYDDCDCPDDVRIDAVVRRVGRVDMGPWWPPERAQVGEGYLAMDFPFAEIAPPGFAMRVEWTLERLVGYFRSWSATQRYVQANGRDPIASVERELAMLWPAGETRTISWPLFVRAGRA